MRSSCKKRWVMEILIVDDTLENIKLIIEVLHDHTISAARSGEEALELLNKEDYDLVLLDIMMPGIDGYITCQRLRELPNHRDTPVIFITAKSDNESILAGFKSGGQDYIKKPFNTQELRARVNSQLMYKRYQNELQHTIELEREKNKATSLTLLQQSKMAQMGEGFSMMAHQWKQPLSSIAAISNALQVDIQLSTLDQDRLLESLIHINENVSHLTRTINEYKDFFKPMREFEKTSPEKIIEKVLLLNKHDLQAHKVSLNLHIQDKNFSFSTLVNELIQVFLVLIQNCIDAFEDKGISGSIDLFIHTENNKLIIKFLDNGGGIADEHLSQIFELNYTSKGKKGSGIGLYMTKQIIEEHLKGSISISNTQSGVESIITLPLQI